MTPLLSMTFALVVIAVAAITAGCVLAVTGYSSAGPFSIASASVGVIGTLVAQQWRANHHEGGTGGRINPPGPPGKPDG